MYALVTVTVLLLCQQHMSPIAATRLPLEVYELVQQQQQQQHTTQIQMHSQQTTEKPSAKASAPTTAFHTELKFLKPKNFEYSIIKEDHTTTNSNRSSVVATTATPTSTTTTTTSATTTTPSKVKAKAQPDEQQQRRSRQMYDLLLQQKHQWQKQQPQQNIRILYQVGESEDDLPVCAPNAVCSKIDLYETPWIERQCRCPEQNRAPTVILHHHAAVPHRAHTHSHGHGRVAGHAHAHAHHHLSRGGHQTSNSRALDKYRSFYEREKAVQQQQHKRLLVTTSIDEHRAAVGREFESVHLKKLMQKLGAVYEDDLHLQASDYADGGEEDSNDAVPPLLPYDMDELDGELAESEATADEGLMTNEFPHATAPNTAHMRHSAHNMAHKAAAAAASLAIGGCPSGLGVEDGHTIADKTRHYKLCQPVHKLPVCKHFRDYTWTLKTSAELNVTEQIVHCRCPKNSVTYLTKRDPAEDGSSRYTYLFACSPLTRIRCQRKQPCKLFTVRKRQEFLDEVNINALCQCPKGHHCPSHHTQSGVIPGDSFLEENIHTYSGYCMAND